MDFMPSSFITTIDVRSVKEMVGLSRNREFRGRSSDNSVDGWGGKGQGYKVQAAGKA